MKEAPATPELPHALRGADAIPSLPLVALEVLRLTADDEVSIDSLAEAIEQDPALSTRLLKLANSSLISPAHEITTLSRATAVLGIKSVKLLSLAFALVDEMPTAGVRHGFDYGAFWRRSLTSAVAARSLASSVGSAFAEEAFVIGLLGHVGKLVMATCLPEEYEAVLEEVGGWPSRAEERARLGFDSGDVAATLMCEWKLPQALAQAVSNLERPEVETEPEQRSLTWIVHCARLAEQVLCDEQRSAPLERLHAAGREHLGLSVNRIDDFLLGLESRIADTAGLLELNLPAGRSHAELLNEARAQMVQVSLGAAIDLQQAERRRLELEQEMRQLESEASTDALTGLANRKAFDTFLARHTSERTHSDVPRALGVLMIDLDHFKRLNDTLGHQAGDAVLRAVGRRLSELTRRSDLAARYGGEEFAVVAPQTTPLGIRTLAERLRKGIEDLVVPYDGRSLRVTASVGCACVASLSSPGDAAALVRLADRHLYKAKSDGRNRCDTYKGMQLPAS